MKTSEIRNSIISAGVRKLKNGYSNVSYPNVNTENILTHPLYVQVFLKILRNNTNTGDHNVDFIIGELIRDLERNLNKLKS